MILISMGIDTPDNSERLCLPHMAFFHLSVLTVLVILCSGTRSESTTLLLVQTTIHNCTVPEWAYSYQDVINRMFEQFLRTQNIPPEQIRLRVGPLLGLLNDNMKKKKDGKTDLKFNLNMAHDVQITGILKALNFTGFSFPSYCSTLLFELHQMPDSSLTVRLRYINTSYPLDQKEEQPVLLVLDGCSEFCPMEYFMESYQSLIPDDWENECQENKEDTSDKIGS